MNATTKADKKTSPKTQKAKAILLGDIQTVLSLPIDVDNISVSLLLNPTDCREPVKKI